MTIETSRDGGRRPATLQLPRQALPVDRTGAAAGALGATAGVEADGFFDFLKPVLPALKSVLPGPVGSVLGMLGL
ncbi:hypothetical protein OHV05_06405 [Kitasatospora sp. NBC_00070]|uniref:hypothetical protein n=1 Tax=Kitasatospora sp. NBC_00070 TaxID=2975962 RepID=UPI0032502D91